MAVKLILGCFTLSMPYLRLCGSGGELTVGTLPQCLCSAAGRPAAALKLPP
ncbi:MAG TPA: hypothetical protein IGP91_02465 [Thermosynechococcus sp. M46_R2017_013]|nr:hypothetical protein [Thermosynechococcus sp. M46_R2017_013]